MKTIQLLIDETLLANVDRAAAEMDIDRSLFIQNAMEAALHQRMIEQAESRHAAGYAARPATDEDVAEWIGEQIWGDT